MWNLQEQQHEKLEKAREGKMVERGWKLFNSIFYMGSFLTHVLLSSKSGSVAKRTAKVHEPRELKDV